MRFILLVLAIAFAFVAWDVAANNGRYVSLIARDLRGSMQFAGGSGSGGFGVVRPPDLSPNWKKIGN